MRYGHNRKSEPTLPQQRRLKTKPLLIIIGILFVCNLLWFIAWLIPSGSKKSNEEVASVNDNAITREEWMAAMEGEIGRETLRELINDKVMEEAAKEYGIVVSEKEIDLELALIHASDNQAYTGLDTDKEREKIRSNLILTKVLTKDIVIEDKAIQENYEQNAALYNTKDANRTSIIIVKTIDEANQTLRELKEGSSFSVLAKERSIDMASANLGGDIGYINESTDFVDASIVQAASKLMEDTISEPVALKDGTYAVIYVSDKLKGRNFKLKEVKEHIKRELALAQLPQTVSPETFWKDFDAKWFYDE
ncbi:peptidyl-prolyl cis-trans isomerase [Sporosarcina pasteurii]|uniref:peptidylprolyl isomerase n=1 Tax=Sporosarcina pasteurii TaxID=1474 RepID=A0A380BD68_SPOPA|nr:peptidyl-prolyl cis-trans isomerase [Sporosarcina pasteurii]MDS9473259.1 peptidyl-prolyl cis-trans isomerase [Sporosarcina pasteurii]QBQ06493.1 foldase [Sporosarcina pasteurii]SUI98338.1 Foldase protein prsA 2 precursor [Sporosarcina pasteurii]